jgi:hypothetical protein
MRSRGYESSGPAENGSRKRDLGLGFLNRFFSLTMKVDWARGSSTAGSSPVKRDRLTDLRLFCDSFVSVHEELLIIN